MICKSGKNFAFLAMLEESHIPRGISTANTVERNRVEKGQHGSLGSCHVKPSFPVELGRQGGA